MSGDSSPGLLLRFECHLSHRTAALNSGLHSHIYQRGLNPLVAFNIKMLPHSTYLHHHQIKIAAHTRFGTTQTAQSLAHWCIADTHREDYYSPTLESCIQFSGDILQSSHCTSSRCCEPKCSVGIPRPTSDRRLHSHDLESLSTPSTAVCERERKLESARIQ
jgi:hypothetical protein